MQEWALVVVDMLVMGVQGNVYKNIAISTGYDLACSVLEIIQVWSWSTLPGALFDMGFRL